jgi:hypothetical protein
LGAADYGTVRRPYPHFGAPIPQRVARGLTAAAGIATMRSTPTPRSPDMSRRITPFIAIVSLSSLTALAVPAVGHAAPQVVDVRGHVLPTRSDVQALHGFYRMSDGTAVTVQAQGRRLVLDLGDGAEVALQPTSASRFVSADGRIVAVFVDDRLRLSMPASARAPAGE